MTEFTSEHDKRNDQQINIKENRDIHFWCEEFNLRAEELKEIVRTVGPAVQDVRLYLAKRLLINWPVTY